MPMLISRRWMLLAAATLPAMGCRLNKHGVPIGNAPAPLTPPFEHAVVLNIVELKDVAGTIEEKFTLNVIFEANVTGGIFRTHSQLFTNEQVEPGFVVSDVNVIDLSESGTVNCRCDWKTFFPEGIEPDTDLHVYNATHDKVAGVPLPEFQLSVDNGFYVLS
jgi:hypothetical protein